jgi:hypothetical protein
MEMEIRMPDPHSGILEGGSELLTDHAVALERTEARSKEELEKRKGSRECARALVCPRHGLSTLHRDHPGPLAPRCCTSS